MLGLGGMNPKNMEKVMKQLGMQTTTIDAEEVVIKCKNKTLIVIANPNIQKISICGQESFQVTGIAEERNAGGKDDSAKSRKTFSEQDIALIMEKTSCTKKQAQKALEETADIAEAIMLVAGQK